jgi:hypothetical protein
MELFQTANKSRASLWLNENGAPPFRLLVIEQAKAVREDSKTDYIIYDVVPSWPPTASGAIRPPVKIKCRTVSFSDYNSIDRIG